MVKRKNKKKITKACRPMAALFSASGSLHKKTSSYIDYTNEGRRFKDLFGDAPTAFIDKEMDLEHKCKSREVSYIPPKPSDSVEASVGRKAELNRAIDNTFPMSVIFSPSGSMYSSSAILWSCAIDLGLGSKEEDFRKIFTKWPESFILLEEKLKQRCINSNVLYIPPTPRDSLSVTMTRKDTLNKAIKAARTRKKRASQSLEEKEVMRCKDRMHKRVMLANESLDGKAGRREATKMASRRAQENESPEKKAARNEAKSLAESIKRKNETAEETECRRKKNRESVRKYLENLDFCETRERVRSYTSHTRKETKHVYVCLTTALLEAAGVMDVKLKYRACLYGSTADEQWSDTQYLTRSWISQSSKVSAILGGSLCTQDDKDCKQCERWPIGFKLYMENGDDMGAMKGWVFGSYRCTSPEMRSEGHPSHRPFSNTKVDETVIAVYDRCDYSSSFEV
jgi:hypothetical protein